jgi:ABC-type multidrug transport system ATPase subunit
MNADTIIVVENGKIIEQGSHDDLIGANGRYADLWSKQVFVKPKDKNEQTNSGTAATIMDDLTVERRNSELAKVKFATQRSKDSDNVQCEGDEVLAAKTPLANKEVEDSAEESTTISLADSDISL